MCAIAATSRANRTASSRLSPADFKMRDQRRIGGGVGDEDQVSRPAALSKQRTIYAAF